jgi:hypothetical protein
MIVRALVLVVALLWACIGSAAAQQTDMSHQGTSSQDQPPALAGATSPPGAAQAQPANAQPSQPASPASNPPASAPTGAPASEPSIDAQAAELLKKLTARQFDGRLPDTPLPDWLAQQLGKRAEVQWTTGDCVDEGVEPDAGQGGVSGAGAGTGNADIALCSEAQALFYDASGKPALDRYVVLQLKVGNRRVGVTDEPSGFGPDALTIFVFDGSSNRTLTRLGDLPGVLASIN